MSLEKNGSSGGLPVSIEASSTKVKNAQIFEQFNLWKYQRSEKTSLLNQSLFLLAHNTKAYTLISDINNKMPILLVYANDEFRIQWCLIENVRHQFWSLISITKKNEGHC